jgi:hypothetical protein
MCNIRSLITNNLVGVRKCLWIVFRQFHLLPESTNFGPLWGAGVAGGAIRGTPCMGVWRGVAKDSLKLHPGPPCPTLLRPTGGLYLPIWTPHAVRQWLHEMVAAVTEWRRRESAGCRLFANAGATCGETHPQDRKQRHLQRKLVSFSNTCGQQTITLSDQRVSFWGLP